jgi:hypothetical protein
MVVVSHTHEDNHGNPQKAPPSPRSWRCRDGRESAGSVLGQIDRWRRKHGAKTRAEAMARLVKLALGTGRGRRVTRKFAAKASELAGRVIDRLADQSATSDEQAQRKRRLLKGPRELRTARRDLRS